MLEDVREMKKEQQTKSGKSVLKAGVGQFRDDADTSAGGTNGEWIEKAWWELSSAAELKVVGRIVNRLQRNRRLRVTVVSRNKTLGISFEKV